MTSQGRNTILISPIGETNTELIEAIAGEVKRVFGFATETRSIIADLSPALDQNRQQYNSTLILGWLAAEVPPQVLKVLAVTQVDLFIPILTS